MALTKIDDRGLKTPIDLLDNEKIRLGTGNDIEFYHDGSNNFIKATNGNTSIIAGQTNINNAADTENCATFIGDGAVNLFHNGIKKFETTTDGVQVTGEVVSGTLHCSGKLDMPDSTGATVGRVLLGDGDDLQLYHDASNSYLKHTGTGDLHIDAANGNSADIRMDAQAHIYARVNGNETALQAFANGAVELYYDNSKKFETTSEGVTLRGTVHRVETLLRPYAGVDVDLGTDGDRWRNIYVYNDIDIKDDGKLLLGDGDDLRIYHTGSHSYVEDAGTGNLRITSNSNIWLEHGTENMIVCNGDGSVELYHDNVKKLETISSGSKTTGYHQQTTPIGFCAYRYDTGTGNEYPIENSSGSVWNGNYFGVSALQSARGQLTTHTEYNNNGSGGTCYSHDGTKFTAPVAGLYYLSFHLSLYVVSDTGGDNSQTWGWFKNQTPYPHNWSSHYSGLNMVQSTSYVIGQDGTTTITDAYELGAPSHSCIMNLAANDEIQIGWSNMSKKMGVRSFTFSGFLL